MDGEREPGGGNANANCELEPDADVQCRAQCVPAAKSATVRGRKRRQPIDDDCIANRTRAKWDMRPWHERQPHVLLQVLFDSGYITQRDAYKCMRVCRQWHDCVNGARKLWRCIEFGWRGFNFDFANWSDGMASAIAAKRPMEISFFMRTAERRHVAAILQRCAHLRRLSLFDVDVDTVRALDSIAAPLTSLELEFCNALDDAAFAEIVASAPMLKLLRELRLYLFHMGDASAQLIAQFTQLSVLEMTDLTSSAVRHLCNGAHTRTTLRELHLDDCSDIESDITEDILALTNLELLSVKYVDLCTHKWGADLKMRYMRKHNRHINVLTTEVDSDGRFDTDSD